MLPLHANEKPYKRGLRIKERVSGWIRFLFFIRILLSQEFRLNEITTKKFFVNRRLIFADQGSRNLFLFLLLNLSMAFVELLYGIWTNRFAKYCFHNVSEKSLIILKSNLTLLLIYIFEIFIFLIFVQQIKV